MPIKQPISSGRRKKTVRAESMPNLNIMDISLDNIVNYVIKFVDYFFYLNSELECKDVVAHQRYLPSALP